MRWAPQINIGGSSVYLTVKTGSPNTSRRGSIPSPGFVEAASLPCCRSGAPVAMLTVT